VADDVVSHAVQLVRWQQRHHTSLDHVHHPPPPRLLPHHPQLLRAAEVANEARISTRILQAGTACAGRVRVQGQLCGHMTVCAARLPTGSAEGIPMRACHPCGDTNHSVNQPGKCQPLPTPREGNAHALQPG
jgi:hypothetical protein